jgi:hypothetical protein
VWELMRPMLSPALVSLNRDAFVVQDERERPSTSPAARPPRASTTSTSTSSTAQPHRTGGRDRVWRGGCGSSLFAWQVGPAHPVEAAVGWARS